MVCRHEEVRAAVLSSLMTSGLLKKLILSPHEASPLKQDLSHERARLLRL